MHFRYYILLLLCFFQGITAYPVNHNHANDRSESNPSIWPSPQPTSGWSIFQAINPWSTHSNDNTVEHNHQNPEAIDIPQHAPKSYHNSIPGRKDTTTQGMFHAIGDFDRVLVPVGVLMAMVWLAFLAGGLVAIVDYVWVQWGRDYSGYSSSVKDKNGEGEMDIGKVEEGGEVKLGASDAAKEDELD